MNELERIVAVAREEVRRRRMDAPVVDLGARAPRGNAFEAAIRRPGISLLAEHKRRSPSAGTIRDGIPLEEVIGAYERGGAAALSILTEESSFGGSLGDLRRARAVTDLPILRKDFIIDPYQLDEAAAAGADAVLLIAAAVDSRQLRALHERARELGLAALVEVHSAPELDRALGAGAEIIGINNRDLTTLSVEVRTTFELRPRIPDGKLAVAESGFSHRGQLERLAAAGLDAVLIGEALMRSGDVETACARLTGAI
jgi:indole-3-glycerol phosphate synthase